MTWTTAEVRSYAGELETMAPRRKDSPSRSPRRSRRDSTATRAVDRPWRVRDRLTQHRYYFNTRSEALAFIDVVSTSDLTGKPLRQWLDRLIVERNR